MAETNDDPLMREIEDELRQEQLHKLWNAYGKYIIGIAVAVVVVVAGYQGWQAYDRSVRLSSTDSLINASELIDQGQTQAAQDSLAKLEKDGAGGIKLLAELRSAGLTAANGDHAGAAAAYNKIAGNTSAPVSFRDLATLMGAVHAFDADPGNAEKALSQLLPLTAPNNVWRHTAREISAMAALQLGQTDKAREFLKSITLDAQAPSSVRSRAEELLQAIGQ